MCTRLLSQHSHMCRTFPMLCNMHNILDIGKHGYKMRVHVFPHMYDVPKRPQCREHMYLHFVPAFPHVQNVPSVVEHLYRHGCSQRTACRGTCWGTFHKLGEQIPFHLENIIFGRDHHSKCIMRPQTPPPSQQELVVVQEIGVWYYEERKPPLAM